mgnify:FL=1
MAPRMKHSLKNDPDTIWDVVVIGGGPAGMMAAARAGERGKKVLLLEKNSGLGKKLLITGGGRCNVTNNKPDVRTMLAEYKGAGKFLFSTFTQHGVRESMGWFRTHKVPLIEEDNGRLFPKTERAQTIYDALVHELAAQKVEIKTKQTVDSVTHDSKKGFFAIHRTVGEPIYTRTCVVATGGTSRPETGSSGEGFAWLKALGHTIVPNNFALVPLSLRNPWVKGVSGIALSDVKITLYSDEKKQSVHNGKILFTHVGVTGPTILNLSKTVGELLAHSTVILKVDMFPQNDAGAFKLMLHQLLALDSNKKLKNALSALLPMALVNAVLTECVIDGETPCHSVSSTDRVKLATILKALPLTVKGLLGANKAVVSAGGVALPEVNFKTMESRLVPGLYVVGDVLNIDRPSGGYSLQLCWSTGFVAGSSV